MVYAAIFLLFAVPAMAMITYSRISERLETPIASMDTETSTTAKQEPIEPVKAVPVSQPIATIETKSSLSMVSDQVDWSLPVWRTKPTVFVMGIRRND